LEHSTSGLAPVRLVMRLGWPRLAYGVAALLAGFMFLALSAGPAQGQTIFDQAQGQTIFGQAQGQTIFDQAENEIPSEYLWQYQATAASYGLDWTILAGIGKVESDHGRIYTAGCILGPPTPYGNAYGPMQFLVSSWAFAGVDGNGDGVYDSCDYRDAIPSAANYLIMHGAPYDYYSSIWAYNHADWYVQEVLANASDYAYYYGR
jgi:soluble lytic murein transglycosylase-like protein